MILWFNQSIPLCPCNYEEFDTRVMLHAANAASQGNERILIIINDTDVIVGYFLGIIWNGQ